MNWKAWAPLGIAIILGVIAAKVARDMSNKNQNTETLSAKVTKVVVAKQTIQPGQAIREEDLIPAAFATEQLPEGTFATTAEVAGRVALSTLIKGQPVIRSLLANPGTGSGLQATVPDGMRAISIDVSESSSVAGLLTPGCHVDVIASINDTQNGLMVARTLVQNVKVTALGQRVSAITKADEDPNGPGPQAFKTVTLLVTPEEAESIELASMTGRPRLVLRGANDNAPSDSPGITLADLTGHPNAPMAPKTGTANAEAPTKGTPSKIQAAAPQPATQPVAEDPQMRTIQMIRGGSESSVSVPIKPQAQLQTQGASVDPFKQ